MRHRRLARFHERPSLHRTIVPVASALLVLAVAGCSGCGVPTLKTNVGHPVWLDREVDPFGVGFGSVFVGNRTGQKVALGNFGSADFTVQSVRAEGAPESFPFHFEPFTVRPGEHVDLSLAFEPAFAGPQAARLVFTLSNADVPELELGLEGLGVAAGCATEPENALDFGAVELDSSHEKQVRILNPTDLAWKVRIAPIAEGPDAMSFSFVDFQAGEHTVPANGELTIPVAFRPSHVGLHEAALDVLAPAMCQRRIALWGQGLEDVLDCEPKVLVTSPSGSAHWACRVELGFVDPGSRARSQFVLRNLGNRDLTVSGFELVQPDERGEPYALELPGAELRIPVGGSVEVPVSFTPTELGSQVGAIRFTSSTRERDRQVELAGVGGGPRIAVSPKRLDYGAIALGSFLPRRIAVANTGTDVPDTTEDNLKFGRLEAGTWTERRPEILSETPEDFELTWPPPGFASEGLAAGTSLGVTVRFVPHRPGARSATLRFYSNDPEQPATDVALSGTGEVAPPCDFELVPARLNFGSVETGDDKTLTLAFVNRSSTPGEFCTIYELDLAPRADGGFSLPEGPLFRVEVAPGQQRVVPVKFTATRTASAIGEVVLHTSSSRRPEARVMLNVLAQSPCLQVFPDELDFGAVKVGCGSREQPFTLANLCPSPITLTAVELEAGLSRSFHITQRPAVPFTLPGNDTVPFKAAFFPTAPGEEVATLSLHTDQPLGVQVLLSGRGTTNPIQTDVFAQNPEPRIDLLLIVDDSQSMDRHRTSLGENFASLMRYALAAQLDFRIAVTSTAVSDTSDYMANGRFLPLWNNPDEPVTRVITPSTPDVEQVFMNNVRARGGGSSQEKLIRPAYLALSEPNLSGHNAGFLRQDARLSIVIVSDAADQDLTPLSFYETFLLDLKGPARRGDVMISAIIPTLPAEPPGCSYDERDSGLDDRVKQLVQLTGGVSDDICTVDWASTLEAIGKIAFSSRTRFYLTGVPDSPDQILVTIDGSPYPRLGPEGEVRWNYRSTDNLLEFGLDAAPRPGSTLSIAYRTACL